MKKLSKHIKTAQLINEEKSPFSETQLRGILENVDSSVQNNPSKFNWKIKMSAIGITIIGLIIGALTMNPLVNKDINTVANKSSLIISKNDIALSTNNQLQTKISQIIAANNSSHKSVDNASESSISKITATATIVIDTLVKNNTLNSYYIDLDPNSKVKNYQPVLVLNKEELKKLYVYFDDDGLYYIDETRYPPYKFNRDDADQLLQLNGYPQKGTLKQLKRLRPYACMLLPYDGYDMNNTLGIYPLTIFTKNNKSDFLAPDQSYSPLVDNNLKKDDYYSSLSNVIKLFDTLMPKNGILENNSIIYVNFSDTVKKIYNDYRLVLGYNKHDSLSKIAFFVYPATSNLQSLLPNKFSNLKNNDNFYTDKYTPESNNVIRNRMDSYLSNIDKLKRMADSSGKASHKPQTVQKSIAGIGTITLTPDELKRFDVSFNSGVLKFPYQERVNKSNFHNANLDRLVNDYNYNFSEENTIVKGQEILDFCNYKFNRIDYTKYTGWTNNEYSKTAPIGIWQTTVTMRKYQDDDELVKTITIGGDMYQSPLMLDLLHLTYIEENKLLTHTHGGIGIPTLSRIISISGFEDNCGKYYGHETPKASLYYYVNREFIELLPDRYKIPLSRELDVLEQIESGDLPAEDACKAIKGQESYMGVCSITASNIVSANVYPNPVSQAPFTADVIVRKEATISVDLYNSTGDLVKRLLSDIPLKGGKNQVKFENTLSGIAPGMYILSFVQDNGERVTRNIIIK